MKSIAYLWTSPDDDYLYWPMVDVDWMTSVGYGQLNGSYFIRFVWYTCREYVLNVKLYTIESVNWWNIEEESIDVMLLHLRNVCLQCLVCWCQNLNSDYITGWIWSRLNTDVCRDGTCDHQSILITSTEETEFMFQLILGVALQNDITAIVPSTFWYIDKYTFSE